MQARSHGRIRNPCCNKIIPRTLPLVLLVGLLGENLWLENQRISIFPVFVSRSSSSPIRIRGCVGNPLCFRSARAADLDYSLREFKKHIPPRELGRKIMDTKKYQGWIFLKRLFKWGQTLVVLWFCGANNGKFPLNKLCTQKSESRNTKLHNKKPLKARLWWLLEGSPQFVTPIYKAFRGRSFTIAMVRKLLASHGMIFWESCTRIPGGETHVETLSFRGYFTQVSRDYPHWN